MKKTLLAALFLFCLHTLAQNNIFYDIPLGNRYGEKAIEHYQNKVSEILSYKIETSNHIKKALLKEVTTRETDSVGIGITYWLQSNGVVLPYLFGATFRRGTEEFLELKRLATKFKLSKKDFQKISKDPNGTQITIYCNYRKVTSSLTKKSHFEHFTYDTNTDKLETNTMTVPVYKGCRVSKKANLHNVKVQEKLKNCMSTKIDKLIKTNFKTTDLSKHPFIKGRILKIHTSFIFNKEGYVEQLNSMSILPELEAEAIRIFKKINPVQPATNEGEPINILFNNL